MSFGLKIQLLQLVLQTGAFEATSLRSCHRLYLHRNLLDDFNAEAFERGYFLGAIREQADAVQVQVGENLRSDTDFALNLFFVVV
jgi:hypothetical protein